MDLPPTAQNDTYFFEIHIILSDTNTKKGGIINDKIYAGQ